MNSPADFHITETPTLHFVATGDEQRLSQDLQARLDESLRQAEEQPEVMAAADAARAADARLQQMRKAERTLHQYARESNSEMAGIAEKTLGAIIDSAAEGKPAFTKLSELTAIEARIRYTGRELMTRARAIEKIAQERAERVLGQLREAVSEEMVLPVDMSKGVSGALLAHAGGLKKLAVQQAENADRIEKSYTARAAKEGR
jgi:hypothetical protein